MTKIDWTKPIENDNGPCEYLGTINRGDPYVHIVKGRYSQHSLLEYIIYVNAQGKPSSVVEFDPRLKVRNVEPEKVCYYSSKPSSYSTAATTVSCATLDKEELKDMGYTHAIKITVKGDKITSITPITL